MRRFRRRRSTQIWLPTYGNANDVDQLDAVIGTAGAVNVLPDGSISTDVFPVTFDETRSAWQTQFNAENQTLHDIVSGQEWKLLRVVGKFHAVLNSLIGTVSTDPPFTAYAMPAAEVALGLIVLRTDEEGNVETDITEHNALAQEAADDPWVWRRKWVIANAYNGITNNVLSGYTTGTVIGAQYGAGLRFPTSTANYNSVADGPHIDQKTRRRIGRETRLFWMISTRMWDPAKLFVEPEQIFNVPSTLYFNLDNRFVGRLSSRMGNRGNSTR